MEELGGGETVDARRREQITFWNKSRMEWEEAWLVLWYIKLC